MSAGGACRRRATAMARRNLAADQLSRSSSDYRRSAHQFRSGRRSSRARLARATAAKCAVGNLHGDVDRCVQFYDLNCPFCRRGAPQTSMARAADKKLELVFVPYAVVGASRRRARCVELAAREMSTPEKFSSFIAYLCQPRPNRRGRAFLPQPSHGLDRQRQLAAAANTRRQAKSEGQMPRLGSAAELIATPAYVINARWPSSVIPVLKPLLASIAVALRELSEGRAC